MMLILNNKCNLTKEEFLNYQEELSEIETPYPIILCPTNINIGLFASEKIELGSQNVSKFDNGAYTGEISAILLKSYNVKYSLVGHSERRMQQKETNQDINEKIKKLLDNNIIPILCVGETKEERDNNQVKEVINRQLSEATRDISQEEMKKIIIAYEPVWSIGTGEIPTRTEIEEVVNYIRGFTPNNKIVYGGSANESNIDRIKTNMIDGYLVGGLSLKPKQIQTFINKL